MSEAARDYTPEVTMSELKPWSPDRWSPRHVLACRLHGAGMKNKEIAEMLDFSESRVSIIINDPRAPKYIRQGLYDVADGIDDIRRRLEIYAHEALDEVVELMRDSTKDEVRQRSAFDILDRAGYTKVEKKVVASAPISSDVADRLLAGREESEIIDAEYTWEEEDDSDGRGVDPSDR